MQIITNPVDVQKLRKASAIPGALLAHLHAELLDLYTRMVGNSSATESPPELLPQGGEHAARTLSASNTIEPLLSGPSDPRPFEEFDISDIGPLVVLMAGDRLEKLKALGVGKSQGLFDAKIYEIDLLTIGEEKYYRILAEGSNYTCPTLFIQEGAFGDELDSHLNDYLYDAESEEN